MAEPTPRRHSRDDMHAGPPPAPRWVKRLGAATLVLVVLFALLHLSGRSFGGHMHLHMQGASVGPAPAGSGR